MRGGCWKCAVGMTGSRWGYNVKMDAREIGCQERWTGFSISVLNLQIHYQGSDYVQYQLHIKRF
jgi:hypothetical protein